MSGLSFGASGADQVVQTEYPQRLRDNLGRTEVSEVQNLFEADFEYSAQPMRWENFISGGATIQQVSAQGGIVLSVTAAAGDVAIRQTRPYIRYQPGKTIYMSSGFLFGTAYYNQRQRVGFFDDGNGIFFEQADPTPTNPLGMGVVYRSDVNGLPFDTRIPYELWSDPQGIKSTVNWSIIQMIWIEFAWYGAGLLRWGVVINGEPYVLHQQGIGNKGNQTYPWSRTGNIPVRYELRNVGPSTAGSMNHYGVSVLAKGKIDSQRGFTYGYGMAAGAPTRNVTTNTTRYPILSFRYRPMGTLEYGVDAAYSGSNGSLPSGGAAITSSSVLAAQVGTSSISGSVLTVGTVTSGTVAVGQLVSGVGVPQGTVIIANISGSDAGSTWRLSTSTGTSSSQTMYMTVGTIINASSATWTTNQWAGKYLWSRGSTSSVSSFSAAANVVTVTTSSAHFLTTGKYLTFSGGTLGTGSPNGTFQITVTGPTTFTYTVPSGSGTAGGTLVYSSGLGAIGRVQSNTATSLTVVDNVLGNSVVSFTASCSNNILTTTGSPALILGQSVLTANGSSLGYITGGSGNSWTVSIGGSYSSQTMTTVGIPYPMVSTPAASGNYILGEIDRGQVLPETLNIFSSANCTLELISSTYYSPNALTGASFATMYSLGSLNSFVERDVSATAVSGGEVVYNTPLPNSGLQNFDLTTFFPLYTTVQGNNPDILTIAISTGSTASSVGASVITQEAMS